jgi:predicted nucleic acid-binding protein
VRNRSIWDPKGIVAVIDTNVLVSARIAKPDRPSSAREIYRLAGVLYDSFTSPAILMEVEQVLARPRFEVPVAETRRWIDVFVRGSRQVDPNRMPGNYAAVLGGDRKDNPILKTALAVNVDEDGQIAIAAARVAAGCYIVSLDTDFAANRNVWGWEFMRPDGFFRLLTMSA